MVRKRLKIEDESEAGQVKIDAILRPPQSLYDFAAFRRQESVLSGLSIVLASFLLAAQVALPRYLGQAHSETLVLLSCGIVVNGFECLWIQRRASLSQAASIRLTWLMIVVNFFVAIAVAYFSSKQDVQYFAIMLPAIIQAAFRLSLLETAITVGVSDALIFFWVWHYFRVHPPVDPNEYVEAGTVALLHTVTGILVWTLTNHLRGKQYELEQTLVELDRVEDKLRTEEKLAAVGRLSSAIAHEIRNPVTMISGALALAAKYDAGSDEGREMYEIANKEAGRLERLTTDFLTYARPRFPELAVHDVADSIGYIADVLKPSVVVPDILLHCECEEGLIARVDAEQLQQAILNLLMNAVQASPDGAKIFVRGRREGGKIVIETENAGGPIAADVAACIFEPFFTTKPAGTGLGLAIARNIVRAHGGDLTLAENTARAVRFEISIPAKALAEEEL